jgi:hypothetical protein
MTWHHAECFQELGRCATCQDASPHAGLRRRQVEEQIAWLGESAAAQREPQTQIQSLVAEERDEGRTILWKNLCVIFGLICIVMSTIGALLHEHWLLWPGLLLYLPGYACALRADALSGAAG